MRRVEIRIPDTCKQPTEDADDTAVEQDSQVDVEVDGDRSSDDNRSSLYSTLDEAEEDDAVAELMDELELPDGLRSEDEDGNVVRDDVDVFSN